MRAGIPTTTAHVWASSLSKYKKLRGTLKNIFFLFFVVKIVSYVDWILAFTFRNNKILFIYCATQLVLITQTIFLKKKASIGDEWKKEISIHPNSRRCPVAYTTVENAHIVSLLYNTDDLSHFPFTCFLNSLSMPVQYRGERSFTVEDEMYFYPRQINLLK